MVRLQTWLDESRFLENESPSLHRSCSGELQACVPVDLESVLGFATVKEYAGGFLQRWNSIVENINDHLASLQLKSLLQVQGLQTRLQLRKFNLVLPPML